MADVFEEDLTMTMLVMLRRRSRRAKQRKHRFWVRRLFLERDSREAYNTLLQEMRLNNRECHLGIVL